MRRKLALAVAGVAVACAVLAGTGLAEGWFTPNDNPWPYNNPGRAPILAAVGDTSCQPRRRRRPSRPRRRATARAGRPRLPRRTRSRT